MTTGSSGASRIQRGCALAGLAVIGALVTAGCADRLPSDYVEYRRLAREAARARLLPAVAEVRPGEAAHRHLRGAGWGGGELDPSRGERFAWVVGREAVVELEHAGVAPAEVAVRGWPYHYDGAPAQRLTAVANGVACAPVTLTPGGFEVVIPIPAGALIAGTNTLQLRFDYAEAPADHEPGSCDQRPLAAAITGIVLASGSADLEPASSAPLLADGEDLLVPPGAVALFPIRLPEGAAVVAERLPATSGGPAPGGRVWVRLAGAGEPRELVAEDGRRFSLLGDAAGTPVELALEGGEHGTRWRRPAIWVPNSTSRPPNVVLIVVDTLRADFVGAYGGPIQTPAMDRLAARGVLFERAWSHIPITGPSHSSLFTSQLPYEHGVRNNSQILPEEAFTLAESMAASGRATAAVVSLGVLRSAFGFGQGFEHYGDRFGRDWMKNAAEVNREVLAWLDTVGDAPYFLFAHYSDPHEPYAPPTRDYPRIVLSRGDEPVGELSADGRGFGLPLTLAPGTTVLRVGFDGDRPELGFRFPSIRVADPDVRVEPADGWHEREKRFGDSVLDSSLPATLRLVNRATEVRNVELEISCKERLGVAAIRERYGEEVAFVDDRIGELLAALERRGDLDHTLVVLTSDHGEGLGDHNHVGHISQLYDTLIRVPLVLSLPGVLPEGQRVFQPAALVDLFPTLAEVLGIDPPVDPHGLSLLGSIRGERVERSIVAETYRPEAATDKRALVEAGHKYIRSVSDERDWRELYDLEGDPGELADLAGLAPDRLDAMATRLDQILAAHGEGPAAPREAPLTEEEKAQLRALGYLRD